MLRSIVLRSIAALLMLTAVAFCSFGTARGEPWRRHTIDSSSRGADGVRLADVNGDGRLDIATGWEEGGQIRAYLHPGPAKAKQPWPAVTVGKVKSPEDAVFADLDGDGRYDVVSCCEGRTRTVYFHWAPPQDKYLDESAWRTTAVPATAGKQSWMFAVPMQIDGQHGVDLVVGAKGKGAEVGWLRAPSDARNVDQWTYQGLYKAGWIMSLESHDVDGDGDRDIVLSDRRGRQRGVRWLENPGVAAVRQAAPWRARRIGGEKHEVMFLDLADLDGDGMIDVLTSTRNKQLILFRRTQSKPVGWATYRISNPAGIPNGKAVAAGDIDLDGRLDLVHSCNNGGKRQFPGVVWMSPGKSPWSDDWQTHELSGKPGVKFDLVKLVDLDGDGDLDVITCEERDNLGVFWYENPTR